MYDTYGGVVDAGKKKRLLIVGVLAVVAVVVAIIIYFVMKTPDVSVVKVPTFKKIPKTYIFAADYKNHPSVTIKSSSDCRNPCNGINCTAYKELKNANGTYTCDLYDNTDGKYIYWYKGTSEYDSYIRDDFAAAATEKN